MFGITDPRPCLICRRPIHADDNTLWENHAVVFTDSAGYGSRHDLRRFQFVICDDCIDACLSDGSILHLSDDQPWNAITHDFIESRREKDPNYDYQAYCQEILSEIRLDPTTEASQTGQEDSAGTHQETPQTPAEEGPGHEV